jgi:hypothetical protein
MEAERSPLMHKQFHEWLDMLDSAAKSVGLNETEWSITVRKSMLPTGLCFSIIGYVRPKDSTQCIVVSGPDVATAIQRVQGRLRECASSQSCLLPQS